MGKNKTSYEALEAHLESDLPEQIEVRVRRERRRRWPLSEKLRILREAFAPGAIASRVAEQYESNRCEAPQRGAWATLIPLRRAGASRSL